MKRSVLLALAIVGVGGVFAAKSFVYAGETPKVEPVETSIAQAELDDEAAWQAWRDDLATLLDADEDYEAAVAAVDAYDGDAEVEYGKLEAVRENRYHEIARRVYEEYFGKWDGTDSDFEDLLATKADSPEVEIIKACGEQARTTCGEGKVCSVTAGGGGPCSYVCAVGGNCPKEAETG